MKPIMNARTDWRGLLRQPTRGDHIVQVYQDETFLSETVGEYLAAGLRNGEGAIVICGTARQSAFKGALAAAGVAVEAAAARGQLVFLDAADTLARFMRRGMPDWTAFHSAVGGAIAALRLDYPAVRAYGDMVDALWRDGQRDAAIRLEEYWNELTRLQTFSLLCAYYLDNLDPASYGGALQCVCKV